MDVWKQQNSHDLDAFTYSHKDTKGRHVEDLQPKQCIQGYQPYLQATMHITNSAETKPEHRSNAASTSTHSFALD